jgi:hypothetical protein
MRQWFAAWWRAWRYDRIVLESTLTVDVVRDRLNMGLTSPWSAAFNLGGNGGYRVIGHAGRSRVTASAGPAGIRNSWRPMLRGHLEPAGRGSRLRGKIGWHPFIWVFSAIWLGAMSGAFLVIFPVIGVAVLAGDPARDLLIGLAPLGFVAFFVGLTTWGERMGRRDEAYLRSWLADRLDIAGVPGWHPPDVSAPEQIDISPGVASDPPRPVRPAPRPPSPGTPAPPRT